MIMNEWMNEFNKNNLWKMETEIVIGYGFQKVHIFLLYVRYESWKRYKNMKNKEK